MKYVGETGQQFHTSLKATAPKGCEKQYQQMEFTTIWRTTKHKIGWDDAVFIDREPHFMRRKIKESIYINALDPSEKHSKIMNLEKGMQQTLAGTNLTVK